MPQTWTPPANRPPVTPLRACDPQSALPPATSPRRKPPLALRFPRKISSGARLELLQLCSDVASSFLFPAALPSQACVCAGCLTSFGCGSLCGAHNGGCPGNLVVFHSGNFSLLKFSMGTDTVHGWRKLRSLGDVGCHVQGPHRCQARGPLGWCSLVPQVGYRASGNPGLLRAQPSTGCGCSESWRGPPRLTESHIPLPT